MSTTTCRPGAARAGAQDFAIGGEFVCAGRRWRCTDVGTRVIVAICLEPATDADWFAGPPYAVAEVIFDEYDLPACTIIAPPAA